MSEENVELVRSLFPGGMDMAAVFADPELLETTRQGFEPVVHPDVETVGDPSAVPMGDFGRGNARGVATGIDGFITLWSDWLSAWETWVLGAPEFIDVDENRVLVLYEVRARSKTHQAEVRLDTGTLLTVHDRKVTRIGLFFDRAKAHKAAGLSE